MGEEADADGAGDAGGGVAGEEAGGEGAGGDGAGLCEGGDEAGLGGGGMGAGDALIERGAAEVEELQLEDVAAADAIAGVEADCPSTLTLLYYVE